MGRAGQISAAIEQERGVSMSEDKLAG